MKPDNAPGGDAPADANHADTADLIALIERLGGASVLCIGDVMLDRFVRGRVDRISPEAPIPILTVTHEDTAPGGAGNVVRNLSALGAKAELIAAVGVDDAARELIRLLDAAPGLSLTVQSVAGRPTSVKTRYLAQTQQLLRTDREAAGPLPAEDAAVMVAAAREALAACGAVVLSDYGKGVLSNAVVGPVIAAAREARRPVVVDPKGRNFARYSGAAVLTPNRAELAAATDMPTGTEDEVVAACRKVIESCGVAAVLATRSEQGMTLVAGDEIRHIPAHAREVFDVAGAGDTVAAVMGAGLAAGATLAQAAALANLAGGVVVGKAGTAVAWPHELVGALHEAATQRSEAKIVDGATAAETAARWRQEGQSVGFTNGCFDLLHPGHVHLLAQAKAACGRLVVGLNSDASVRRLKGPERPVQNEASRAAVLASLASVDLVVPFAEDTPIKLITRVRPDVLVKGRDYTVDQVVGAAEVRSWGGRVVLADLLDGHSTTGTLAKLRA